MQLDLTEIVITLVGLVFSAVIIPLTKAAFTWMKERTRSEALLSALEEAQTVADNVVASLQANVVGGLKEKSADGKLSAKDIKAVAGTAVDMFLSDVSAGSLEVLAKSADDLTVYIRNLIEARLLASKKLGVPGDA